MNAPKTTVTIYRFSVYDIQNDEQRLSRRWATKDAVERIRSGVAHEETAAEVDPALLDDNGMTKRDFDPHHKPFRGSMK